MGEIETAVLFGKDHTVGEIDVVIEENEAIPEEGGVQDDQSGGKAAVDVQTIPALAKQSRKTGAPKKRFNPIDVKAWLKIDLQGNVSIIQADKHKITHKLGLQPRDLRFLDPHMSAKYPPAILDRENATIVYLEFIRCVITAGFVLVVNHDNDMVALFVEALKQQISAGENMQMPGVLPSFKAMSAVGNRLQGHGNKDLEINLPFELKALEVCLDTVAAHLEKETTDLEAVAYPLMNNLEQLSGTSHLETVRRLKTRMVRLTTRVQAVCEVLEKFLSDDQDMHNLHLSARQAQAAAQAANQLKRLSRALSISSVQGISQSYNAEDEVLSVATNSSEEEAEIQEVEMLLQAYFMYIDNTRNRLQTMDEYIKDTEDLVNMKLGQHRNKLIAMELIITSFTAFMGFITVFAGLFGTNLNSGFNPSVDYIDPEATGIFVSVSITTCVGCFLLFILFLVWCWWKKLLEFKRPSSRVKMSQVQKGADMRVNAVLV